MGLEKRPVTFRFSEDTLRQIDQIKESFGPLLEDRTSALRFIVRLVWGLLFTPHSLKDMLAVCQRLQSHTHTTEYRQLSFRFPPNRFLTFRPNYGGFPYSERGR